MPYLTAYVPSRMKFTEKRQINFFQSPARLESEFAEKKGERIGDAYVRQLTDALYRIYSGCIEYSAGEPKFIEEFIDVLYVAIGVKFDCGLGQIVIELQVIKVRPCFSGYGLLTALVYLLLRAAYVRGGVKHVVVTECTAVTTAILQRKFGTMMESKPHFNGLKNCFFTDIDSIYVQVSIDSLGLTGNFEVDPASGLKLIEGSFPTSSQLNDPLWVERHARFPIDPELLAAEQELERLFVDTRGTQVNDGYVSAINDMLSGLFSVMMGDLKSSTEEFERPMDVVMLRVKAVASSQFRNVFTLQVISFVERPCFLGYGMLPIIILQLLHVAWKRQDIDMVRFLNCDDSMANIIKQMFPSAAVLNFEPNLSVCNFKIRPTFQDSSCVDLVNLGVSELIQIDTSGLVSLNERDFPTAAELNSALMGSRRNLRAHFDAEIRHCENLLYGIY